MNPKPGDSQQETAGSHIGRRELLKSSALGVGGAALLGAAQSMTGEAAPRSAARESALRIDTHAHYFPTEYLERLDRYGASKLTATAHRLTVSNQESKNLDARLQMMDRGGVKMQIISCSNVFPYFEDEVNAVDAARLANDLYADLVRKYPQRFAAFACTPLPHLDASLKEMQRGLDELGMVGVTVATFALGRSIADPMFEPLFAELNRRKAVVFIHPTGGGGGSQVLDATKLVWPIGAPLEDSIILMQFVQQDYPRRYPDMKVIIPHLGGFAPFLMTRFDQFRDQYMSKDFAMPSVQSKYFWYDTVNGNPAALRCACDTFGPDKIMLGTDFPYWVGDALQAEIDYLKQPGFPAHVEQALYGANARKLLALRAARA
jgi:predicted TIM-barrel fold metal-dependent hydrolase